MTDRDQLEQARARVLDRLLGKDLRDLEQASVRDLAIAVGVLSDQLRKEVKPPTPWDQLVSQFVSTCTRGGIDPAKALQDFIASIRDHPAPRSQERPAPTDTSHQDYQGGNDDQ